MIDAFMCLTFAVGALYFAHGVCLAMESRKPAPVDPEAAADAAFERLGRVVAK